MKPLSGKTALITCASRGIGEATARELAAQGARVFLTARSRGAIAEISAEINEEGGQAAFLASDMSRHLGVESVVKVCREMMESHHTEVLE